MGEILETIKETLKKEIKSLEELSELSYAQRIQKALDIIIRNEKKIWLRTRKGQEMLSTIRDAAKTLSKSNKTDENVFEDAIKTLEHYSETLEKEIRRRSMVVT